MLHGFFASTAGIITPLASTAYKESHLKIEAHTVKLKKDYLSKFQRLLPAQKVVRYYQIENKIEAIIDYDLVDTIRKKDKKKDKEITSDEHIQNKFGIH